MNAHCSYYQALVNCSVYQEQVLDDIIEQHHNGTESYDGIASAPCGGNYMAPQIARVVKETGISVVTFDSDACNSSHLA